MEPNRLVDRQRLDLLLAETARAATDPATRAQLEVFEALIRTRHGDRAPQPFESLRDQITDFIMPRIGSPGILQSSRYTEVLTRIVKDILPAIGEGDEISGIAALVVEEEIERHRELQDRIYQALSA